MEFITPYILAFGYIGIFLTIFAESGLFIGFFLPGDSLLFALGLLASKGQLNIYYLIIICVVGAILGDSFGYWMGYKFGPSLFSRSRSFFFRAENVEKTQKFFEKHGNKTIFLARFVPIVRTFAPILAGIGKMEYKSFLTFNIIGGIVWAVGFLGISYYLGKRFEGIENGLVYIVIGIIVISVLPIVFDYMRKKE